MASAEPALQQSPWLPSGRTAPRPVGGARAARRPARPGGGPAVHPRPQRRARRAGRPAHPHGAGPPRPAPRRRATTDGAQSLQVLLSALGLGLRVRPGGRARRAAARRSARPRAACRPGPSRDRAARPVAGGVLPNDRTGPGPAVRRRTSTAAWCRPSASWSRRPTRCASSCRPTRGSWSATSRRSSARFRRRPPTQFVGAQPSLLAPAPVPAGPVRRVRREHGAGLGLAVPRRRAAASSGPSRWCACCGRCWSTSGPAWSRTCWSSRCSRRPRA